jgi:hypothetical protein
MKLGLSAKALSNSAMAVSCSRRDLEKDFHFYTDEALPKREEPKLPPPVTFTPEQSRNLPPPAVTPPRAPAGAAAAAPAPAASVAPSGFVDRFGRWNSAQNAPAGFVPPRPPGQPNTRTAQGRMKATLNATGEVPGDKGPPPSAATTLGAIAAAPLAAGAAGLGLTYAVPYLPRIAKAVSPFDYHSKMFIPKLLGYEEVLRQLLHK